MEREKFKQMVREFPFIRQVIAGLPVFTGYIDNILVKCVDRNLLEIQPGGWCHDGGGFGADIGYRRFWCVAPGELIRLEEGQYTTRVPHGVRINESADPIGVQLCVLDRDVQYIVEASDERFDWEDPSPTITVYKVKDFDWRKYARPEARQG